MQVGFDFDKSVYLPCAAGAIIAYSMQDEEITDRYDFADIIFKREKLSSALSKLDGAYLAAFSCSVWNMEYNRALAKELKRTNPDCITVFGGHNVSDNCKLFETDEYIDILMFGEGEEPFAALLKAFEHGDISAVPNIAYKTADGIHKTEREYYTDISVYPSACLTGVFDKIIAENPDTDFLAVLETNRGCPYSCAYCDWCAGKKLRLFPMEKVMGEIRWLSENKIEYCFCADSNFGMFERDVEIVKELVRLKTETGYPKVFRPTYEKNSDERVFEICSLLNTCGMDKGATMAYQTLCEEALVNIHRKNLTREHFASLQKRYNKAGIPTYSELILGLPGETYESFCRGMTRLLEDGQHNSLSVYHCEVLENSDMAQPEYIEKHGIEVIKVAFNHIHSAINRDEEVQEYSYLVRSTATLSREDWVKANLFSVCLQCFHSLGLLRYAAIYLYGTKKATYLEFYSALIDYIMNQSDGFIHDMFVGFEKKYSSSLKGDWNYHKERFGNTTWFFEEGAFLEIVDNYDAFVEEITPFLNTFDFDADVLGQLMQYQRAIIRKPFTAEESVVTDYDFHSYFTAFLQGEPIPLEKVCTKVTFSADTVYESFGEYAKETVWYGRRRGRAVYGKNETVCTRV